MLEVSGSAVVALLTPGEWLHGVGYLLLLFITFCVVLRWFFVRKRKKRAKLSPATQTDVIKDANVGIEEPTYSIPVTQEAPAISSTETMVPRMMDEERSSSLRALRKRYGILSKHIKHPELLAGILYSMESISEEVKKESTALRLHSKSERTSIILNVVEDNLKKSSDPLKVMETFCTALEDYDSEEPALKESVAFLRKQIGPKRKLEDHLSANGENVSLARKKPDMKSHVSDDEKEESSGESENLQKSADTEHSLEHGLFVDEENESPARKKTDMTVNAACSSKESDLGPVDRETEMRSLEHSLANCEEITKWRRVGINLGLSGSKLNEIQENNRGSVDAAHNCWLSMVREWLNGTCELKTEKQGLKKVADALANCGEHTVAKSLYEKAGVNYPQRNESHPFNQAAALLKKQYEKYLRNQSDWDLWPGGKDTFCKLSMLKKSSELKHTNPEEEREKAKLSFQGSVDAIIAQSFHTYSPIKLGVFFEALEEDSSVVPRILVRGPPGVGKTTLCLNTCQMWGKGEILKQYSLVLYLPLRDAEVAKAETFSDLLYLSGIPKSQAESMSGWIETDGKGILLVIDGWDELDIEIRNSSKSLVSSIVNGKRAGHLAFFLTSRPHVITPRLRECFTCEVEILGFAKEEVKKYIREKESSKEQSDILISCLEARPNLMSLCSIPCVCTIMLVVFHDKNELPVTLSELYEEFVLSAINKHESKAIGCHILNLRRLPDLLVPYFQKLCEFSYSTLCEKLFSFKGELLDEKGLTDLVRKHNCFSLLTAYPVTSGDEFQFLHLTIQEFLAGWWIAHHNECVNMFSRHYHDDHFNMTLKFAAGISKLKNKEFHNFFNKAYNYGCPCAPHPSYILRQENAYYFKVLNLCRECKRSEELLFILQLIYESQNPNICEVVAACMGSEICLLGFGPSLNFQDFIAFNYFLSNSKKSWAALHLDDHPSLPLLTVLMEKQVCDYPLVCDISLTRVLFSSHIIVDSFEDVESLPTTLQFNNIQSLSVGITSKDLQRFASQLKNCSIHKLRVAVTVDFEEKEHLYEEQVMYWDSFISALQESSALEELYLCLFLFDPFAVTTVTTLFSLIMEKILSALALSKSLNVFKYEEATQGRWYDFGSSWNDFKSSRYKGTGLAKSLVTFCSKSSSLQVLDFPPGIVLPEEYLENIAKHFSGFSLRICPLIVCYNLKSSITHLNLSNASLSDSMVLMIAKYLKDSATVTHLDLSDNQITAEGASAIFKSITSTSVLRELIMNRNEFTHGVGACSVMGKPLAQMLETSKSLRTLYLLHEHRVEDFSELYKPDSVPGRSDCILDYISNSEKPLSLTELGVSTMFVPFTPQHIYEKFFTILAKAKIREVTLQFCYDMDSLIPYLCDMIGQSTSLQVVIISVMYQKELKPLKYTHRISIESIRQCTSLRKLFFIGQVDHARLLPDLTQLKEEFPKLEVLFNTTFSMDYVHSCFDIVI